MRDNVDAHGLEIDYRFGFFANAFHARDLFAVVKKQQQHEQLTLQPIVEKTRQ